MNKNRQRVACSILLLAAWLITVSDMIASAMSDTGPTGLAGDLPNWHNSPGDLSRYIVLSGAELLVVLAVLRPRSYDYSWPRALVVLLCLTPWTLFFIVLMMHSGGIMVAHTLWLLGLWISMAVLTAVSAIAEMLANRRHDPRLFPRRSR